MSGDTHAHAFTSLCIRSLKAAGRRILAKLFDEGLRILAQFFSVKRAPAAGALFQEDSAPASVFCPGPPYPDGLDALAVCRKLEDGDEVRGQRRLRCNKPAVQADSLFAGADSF